MRRLDVKAEKVRVGSTMILVQTKDRTGKKAIEILKRESTYDNTSQFKALVSQYFKDYEKNFEIIDMMPEVACQTAYYI